MHKSSAATHSAPAAEIIEGGGVVVSQFFPTAKPSAWSFPKRNEVSSGISQETVVIEASQKSGARMQARPAYEHGKQVFLVESLATAQKWARTMLERGRATSVRDFDDLARELVDADRLLAAGKELHLEPFALQRTATAKPPDRSDFNRSLTPRSPISPSGRAMSPTPARVQSAKWIRSASSSDSMSALGTTPTCRPILSVATERTSSACAFESNRSPVSGAVTST